MLLLQSELTLNRENRMFVRLIISSLAVGITAWLMDSVKIEPWWAIVLVAIVMGLVNAIVRPVVKFFSLPLTVLTLGLFTFVINALMVLLCAFLLGDHFQVDGFVSALVFSVIVSVVSWLIGIFAK